MLSANAKFLSNEISVFGLRLAVDQAEIVAFGQIVVLILLAIFCLHILANSLDGIKSLLKLANDQWRERSLAEVRWLNESQYRDDSDYESDPMHGLEDWEFAHEVEDEKRKKREMKVEFWIEMLKSAHSFITSYALVISLSLIAVFYPTVFISAVDLWLGR